MASDTELEIQRYAPQVPMRCTPILRKPTRRCTPSLLRTWASRPRTWMRTPA
ncbi:hypothetical protein PUV44_08060 [Xanthomonas arboricola pv. corylina]|nr:hypothetical protein PUV44_08060 [Xanthomonas arboricola pv. corylina]